MSTTRTLTTGMATGAVLIAALFYVQNGTGNISNMDLVSGASRLRSSLGPELSGEALDAYRTWSRRPEHFGSFAASEYGRWGWTSGYNDPEAADTAALANCAFTGCKVFARSVPAATPREGEKIVRRETMERFQVYLWMEGAKAFATHPSGASGSSFGAGSLRQARTVALKECREWMERSETPPPAEIARIPCTIVHQER